MPTLNKDTKTTVLLEDPQKLVQNLVDKKIRNLEKRKTRLNELKDLAAKGQELEPEQQQAIKKLDQVVEMIDLMKDLNKSIAEVLTENTKQQKRIAKKELLDKQIENKQQELERLKTIIQFQDVLGKFDSNVRQDFVNGTNGAIQLSGKELSHLDQLFAITEELSEDKIESTTEKLMALADGKTREAFDGVSFQQLKQLLIRIIETKYFSRELQVSTTTAIPSTNTSKTTNKSKADNSMKKFTKENDSMNTTQTNSTQFQTPLNTDFTSSLIQSQFAPGISFMTNDPLVRKDPAVVAVSSIPNAFPSYQSYGIQSNDSLINAISDSNNPSMSLQKNPNFDTTSMPTIPTQTFTNQQFAALIPGAAPYAVPVTLAPVSMVAQDLTGQMTNNYAQTFANQQNFMNSNALDKQPNPSQERGNNFNTDDNRNTRNRGNRTDGQKKNMNGFGNRSRNTNKGTGYQNPNQMFGTYSSDQTNGSTFGNNTFNSTGDKTVSNNWNGSRGRAQQNRTDRTDRPHNRKNPNANYNSNFTTTAAK